MVMRKQQMKAALLAAGFCQQPQARCPRFCLQYPGTARVPHKRSMPRAQLRRDPPDVAGLFRCLRPKTMVDGESQDLSLTSACPLERKKEQCQAVGATGHGTRQKGCRLERTEGRQQRRKFFGIEWLGAAPVSSRASPAPPANA